MKICNDCEAIFSDHYTECPSCKGKNTKRYLLSVKQAEEIEEVEPITAYVEFTELTDFES